MSYFALSTALFFKHISILEHFFIFKIKQLIFRECLQNLDVEPWNAVLLLINTQHEIYNVHNYTPDKFIRIDLKVRNMTEAKE